VRRSCRNCLWYDSCGSSKICEYYDTIEETFRDIEIEKMIEKEREEFAQKYRVYANQYSDGNEIE